MHRQVADLQDNSGAVVVDNIEAVLVAVGNIDLALLVVDSTEAVLLVVGNTDTEAVLLAADNTDIAGDTAAVGAPSDTEDWGGSDNTAAH